MSTPRTDVHRPAALTTEDYQLVDVLDFREPMPVVLGPNANGQYMTIPVPAAIMAHRRRLLGLLGSSAAHREHGRCDHCGAVIRYTAILKHMPTGEHISVGEQCMDNRFSRTTEEFQKMRKAAELDRQQQRIRKAVAAFVETNPDLWWMATLEESQRVCGIDMDRDDGRPTAGRRVNYFVLDISHRLRRYGEISERQIEAVRKSLAKDAEMAPVYAERAAQRAAEEAAATPVVVGRIAITGTVLSTKWQEGSYGEVLKMLVRDDRGFKVWGTAPSSISVERGSRVTFTATVEASNDDETFGFYGRPSGASVLDVQPEPVAAGAEATTDLPF